jgi:hypothetical protein
MTYWRFILIRPKFPPVLIALRKRRGALHLKLALPQTNDQEVYTT